MSIASASSLPDPICTRIAMAEEDLKRAEQINMGTATNAVLVRSNETLRSSLFDMIRLVRQLLADPGQDVADGELE